MVLLKNDGTLPIKAGIHRIAVIGPLADQTEVMFGNYHGEPSRAVSALAAIRRQFPDAEVTFDPGTDFLRDVLAPVPSLYLMTPDGRTGLRGEYFHGTDLSGQPSVIRNDRNVNFYFGGNPPAEGFTGNDFSVRWTGVFVAPVSGEYKLGVYGDDGYRLWLDGKLLVQDWTTKIGLPMHGPSTNVETVTLEKDRKYQIKLEYFQHKAGAAVKLLWRPPMPQPEMASFQAARNARAADLVIAVAGITSQLEGEEMKVDLPGFHEGDRTSLDIPEPEEKMLKLLRATGKPLVMVLMNGSALSVNWASRNANAILDAWYPGEEGGTAIAETLAGKNNPAGRLPVTFYTGVDQLPPFTDYDMANRTYRFFKGAPLYPFGYGLSYSKFEYSGLKLSSTELNAGDTLNCELDVKNVSDRAGDEVVQAYLTFPPFSGAPKLALRGFTRIHLAAGKQRIVHFALGPRDLSAVDKDGDRLVMQGEYGLSIGGGQPGTGAPVVQTQFTIQGEQRLPE
jgi:beta-glucosidase